MKIGIGILILLVVGVVWFFADSKLPNTPVEESGTEETAFEKFGLKTNTAKASIPLEKIVSGGPGKDGIPALDHPSFVPIAEAQVGDETLGMLVTIGGEKRFYPYNILVWHEVVNDSIGDTHFAVTFCPLCGSAIVFDRRVGDEVLTFGVSGLLYESNLLMYDTKTESLWSQAGNEAVVGDYTGTKLSVLDMRLVLFSDLKELHPDALVLSRDTGYDRTYDLDPYAGYGLVDDLYFPVSVSDKRFPPKQIMYVIPLGNVSIALPDALLETTASLTHGTATLVAERVQDGISVTANGESVPGYYEMWFSWATQHEDDGVVWSVELK